MKIVASAVDSKITGSSVSIADDKTWAEFVVYTEDGIRVTVGGTPKELRKLGNHIISGLRSVRTVRVTA